MKTINLPQFKRNRVYNIKDSIIAECNYDDRKNKVGSPTVPLPKYIKSEKPSESAGLWYFMRQLRP